MIALISDSSLRVIVPQNNKCSHCTAPICAAYQFGKQKCSSPPLNANKIPLFDGGVREDIVTHGQCISVDLFMSHQTKDDLVLPLARSHPRPSILEEPFLLTILPILFSIYISFLLLHMKLFDPNDSFESICTTNGVSCVKEHITDNNSEYKSDCEIQNQLCHFSGVGAHHQNYSERCI